MEPIEVKLTTPPVRLEDLLVLVNESAKSVVNQLEVSVDPMETQRYETVVSVTQL